MHSISRETRVLGVEIQMVPLWVTVFLMTNLIIQEEQHQIRESSDNIPSPLGCSRSLSAPSLVDFTFSLVSNIVTSEAGSIITPFPI